MCWKVHLTDEKWAHTTSKVIIQHIQALLQTIASSCLPVKGYCPATLTYSLGTSRKHIPHCSSGMYVNVSAFRAENRPFNVTVIVSFPSYCAGTLSQNNKLCIPALLPSFFVSLTCSLPFPVFFFPFHSALSHPPSPICPYRSLPVAELSHAWGNRTEHRIPTWQPPAVRVYTCESVYGWVGCVFKERERLFGVCIVEHVSTQPTHSNLQAGSFLFCPFWSYGNTTHLQKDTNTHTYTVCKM